jgi:hypothetical protein
MALITCPNCLDKFYSKHKKNRWVEWFEGECYQCGWSFKIKDFEFDLIQPYNPLFEEVYHYHPEKAAQKIKKQKELDKELRKANIEKKHAQMVKQGKLKPWDLKYINKYVEERKL